MGGAGDVQEMCACLQIKARFPTPRTAAVSLVLQGTSALHRYQDPIALTLAFALQEVLGTRDDNWDSRG